MMFKEHWDDVQRTSKESKNQKINYIKEHHLRIEVLRLFQKCILWSDKWYFRSQITSLITLRTWKGLWVSASGCIRRRWFLWCSRPKKSSLFCLSQQNMANPNSLYDNTSHWLIESMWTNHRLSFLTVWRLYSRFVWVNKTLGQGDCSLNINFYLV